MVTGDGTKGYAPDAPYDRVISTASVRTIPAAWIGQTRPGGVLVVPWGSDYGDDALTRLVVAEDGSASGRCGADLAFMRLRSQRRDFLEPSADQIGTAATTRTAHGGRELFEMVTFTRASFTIGLRVPFCYLTVEDVTDDRRLVELHDVRTRSWARVTLIRGQTPWTVHQLGPRRLWDEADTAYSWWRKAGEPTPNRFGPTVTPDGTHTVWLDTRPDFTGTPTPAPQLAPYAPPAPSGAATHPPTPPPPRQEPQLTPLRPHRPVGAPGARPSDNTRHPHRRRSEAPKTPR
ncbi:hypothetical protein D5S19_11430, partial [Amycolatopsis panacis]